MVRLAGSHAGWERTKAKHHRTYLRRNLWIAFYFLSHAILFCYDKIQHESNAIIQFLY